MNRDIGWSDQHAEPKGLSDKEWERLKKRVRDAAHFDLDGERGASEWAEIMKCVEACSYVDRMRRVGVMP